ncbi:MAG: DUF6265 family protein [Rhizomicrobium sp.]
MKALLLAVLLAATPAAATTVRDLAWMAGDRSVGDVHEVWLDGGDLLLGASVTVMDGKAVEREFMRVGHAPGGGIAFFAEVPGQPVTVFMLKSFAHGRAVFENPTHDFPQRVIYWNAGRGKVGARIEGTIQGEPHGQEWLFQPAP